MAHPIGDPVDEVQEIIRPVIAPLVRRLSVDEFTTVEFIEAMQLDESARRAYAAGLDRWPESDEHLAKMVIHGQVIPALLRACGLVEWAGFAHGETDPYAIPAWWRKLDAGR